MLYHLLYPLSETFSVLNVFRYVTFRTLGAALTSLAISFILGPWIIERLSTLRIKETIRKDGPASHFEKEGTPTMGGTLILLALISSTLLWTDLTNIFVWAALLVTSGLGILGFVDDYLKLRGRDSQGVRVKTKLFFQLLLGFGGGFIIFFHYDYPSYLVVPFFKQITPDIHYFYILLAVVVIVGTSNAVNLTDGLDGLAIGPVTIASGTFVVFSYLAGHIKFAEYLQIPYIPGSGELAVFCAAMTGAGLGFLWFNTYPAQVFMGDIGSLSLGGGLGTVAVITKNEIVLVLVGGIFVVETLSVITQVVSFKLTGKRVFQMAPLHHHFELKGWMEPKIIVRFWIIAIILALFAMSTLKLR